MNYKSVLLASLLLALTGVAALASGTEINTAPVVTWKGGQDSRWSNPANWEGGKVPGASDVARFAAGGEAGVLVDADSPGVVVGLIMEADYRGTLTLGRDLSVSDELLVAGGTLDQRDFRLSVKRYLQTGGKLIGGSSSLTIREAAVVRGGTLLTSRTTTAASLTIQAPAVVTMAADSKLSLTGDGEPLNGDGTLDVIRNRPNSLEYTGQATADVMAATPLKRGPLGRAAPSRAQMISGLKSLAPQEPSALGASSFARVGSLTLTAEEDYPFCAVIDTARGFAYFGTLTSPGIVVKVRLSDFKRVGAVVLNQFENDLRSAVIDPVNGFAYFGTLTGPGTVVKIRLSDFTHVASLTLEPEESDLAAAVIDTANGYAYFGAYTSPGIIVKIRLSDFTRVGALYLKPEEAGLLTGVLDPAKGFAYFGTGTVPGIVIKVRLSDFTRVDSVTLNYQEDELTCSVIDATGSFAYFGSFGLLPRIIKVRLSDMTRVGDITIEDGTAGDFLRSAVIDTARGYAYFGTGNDPGKIIRVRLSDFSYAGLLTLDSSAEGDLLAAVIDPDKGFAYFSTLIRPGVAKVRLSDFTRAGWLPFSRGEDGLGSAVIDTAAGFAYFGTHNNPGLVAKVRLSDFTRVGVLNLKDDEIFLRSAVIDTAGGFAYFGTDRSPGKVIKVRLSDFTRADVLTLNAGENYLYSAVLDAANGFAYFGTVTNPAIVVKVRLSDFTRVGALNTGQNQHRAGVIDAAGAFAYFAGGNGIVKVRLSDLTKAASTATNNEEFLSGVVDAANGYAYFGTVSGKVVRLRLSDLERTNLTLAAGETYLYSGAIDTANGFAYFGTGSSPGRVIKVRLSDLKRVEAVTLNEGENHLYSAVIDPARGLAYFGTATSPGIIVKLDLTGATLPPPMPTSPGWASQPGTEVPNATPTFQWGATAAATRYGLYISKYPYGSINVIYKNETLTGTSFTLPGGVLVSGGDYRWEMKAFNSSGASGASNALYFSVREFTQPAVTTAAATVVKGTSATLNGTVNPNGTDTTAWFEWGTSSTLATFNQTPAQSIESGAGNSALAAGLTGLTPNTTYYFRAAASNSEGAVKGGILSFKTPALPGLRVNNVSVTEANTGSNTSAAFTVTLSAASAEPVSVQYATANVSAIAPNDYTALAPTTLTFSPGQTTKTVTVQVKGDALDEATETFKLLLSNAADAVILDGLGVGTILDNDPPPAITISDAPPVTEPDTGNVYASFTVKLSAASGRAVSVKYATGGGTATAGTDYAAVTSGALSFPAGQTLKTIRIAVKGDTTNEPNETFFVNLSGAVNATISDAQGQATIVNDD